MSKRIDLSEVRVKTRLIILEVGFSLFILNIVLASVDYHIFGSDPNVMYFQYFSMLFPFFIAFLAFVFVQNNIIQMRLFDDDGNIRISMIILMLAISFVVFIVAMVVCKYVLIQTGIINTEHH